MRTVTDYVRILLVLVSAVSCPLSAVSGEEPAADGTAVVVSFSPDEMPSDDVIESLEEGHRAEIRYELRVFREVAGIRKLFGDRLIAELYVLYEARKDPLNATYVVTVGDSRELVFDDRNRFLDFFFSLDGYRMEIPVTDTSALYVLGRAELEPMKLVPPLTLMPIVFPGFRTTTAWKRIPFREVER